jgi:indolepyruvate ferredoxin oxidoreductase beta subunit
MGMIAASGTLPIPLEACRAAMAGGKAASDANTRGFEAGVALIRDLDTVPDLRGSARGKAPAQVTEAPRAALPPSPETAFLPGEAAGIAAEGMRRLTDWQDAAYAATYLAHLRRLSAHPAATPALLASVARHMALRMSYEDTHRVAQLKLSAARMAQVHADARARPGDIVDVAEYMKPGPEEIAGMLPRRLGERLLALVERHGWQHASFPMRVRATRFSGFARLRLLAWARRWRPLSLRHHQETEWLAEWLAHIHRALDVAPAAAEGIAETAPLVRGYGSTYKRGMRNWRLIADRIITPCLTGQRDPAHLADAVLQARLAATRDPEGQTLDRMVTAFEAASTPRAAAE